MMSNHLPISDDELLAYVLGDLPAMRREEIALAAAASSELQARIGTWRGFVADVSAAAQGERAGLFEVSREKRAALTQLIKQDVSLWRRASEAIDQVGSQVAALLVFDSSREAAAAAGFRGSVAERLLRFEFDGGSVDLRLSEVAGGGGRVMVQGEVELADQQEVVRAKVMLMASGTGVEGRSGAEARSGTVIEADVVDGYFELLAGSGTYQLLLAMQRIEIVLQPVVIERM